MSERREDGFTVIELLLSIAILTIIVGTISSALVVFFSNGSYAIGRDDHSAGAGITASYLDRDLLSAETGTTNATAPCHSGTKDLVLRWDEWTASATAVTPAPGESYASAYDLVTVAGGSHQLERWYCKGTTLLAHAVLLDGLASGDFSASPGAAMCAGGATPVVLELASYRDDTLGDYSYSGCLKGRLS